MGTKALTLGTLILLAACGGKTAKSAGPSGVHLSFATFSVVSTSYWPQWAPNQSDNAPDNYQLTARPWDGDCAQENTQEFSLLVLVGRGGLPMAAGMTCPVANQPGPCTAAVLVEKGTTRWTATSGSVRIVSLGDGKVTVHVDVQIPGAGFSCGFQEQNCTCTNGPIKDGACPEAEAEPLQLDVEGVLCPAQCVCPIEGVDACTCVPPG